MQHAGLPPQSQSCPDTNCSVQKLKMLKTWDIPTYIAERLVLVVVAHRTSLEVLDRLEAGGDCRRLAVETGRLADNCSKGQLALAPCF